MSHSTDTDPDAATFPDDPAEFAEVADAEIGLDPGDIPEVGSRDLLPVPSAPSAASGGELVPFDPLRRYLAEVRQYSYLDREEEHALALAFFEHGDREAAQRLIMANLRLVVRLAYEYKKTPINLLDLIQEGNLGLMAAVRKFDPHRGTRLGTYAAWWIKAYMLRYIMANWKMVRIGTTQEQRKLFFNLLKEKERLESQGYEVGPRLLAEHLNVKESTVVQMEQTLSTWDRSLDEPVADGSDMTHGDQLADPRADPAEAAAQRQLRELIAGHLATFGTALEGRDREIFFERLMSAEPVTLQEIASRHGVTRERVRQNEKRMLERLRAYLSERVEGIEGLDFSISAE
ncbi:MAG: RNA polymerase factor sigma-32 [Nitrospirota bacterium]|nr:RNA polymerase factor sigma-32 [Nitrospirota bacterium]